MKKKLTILIQFLLISLIVSACEDDTHERPKPAETEVPQPVQYGTPFENVPETPDVAMYEVNLRAFSQAGNLSGVTENLDSLENLGINVVWLMPIYPTGDEKSVGSPYAVKDYMDIHEDYGTLADLRELVEGLATQSRITAISR